MNTHAATELQDMMSRTKVVYLYADQEVPDFTAHAPFSLIVAGGQRQVHVPIDRENLAETLGMLDMNVFDGEKAETVVTWNLKSILSFFRAYIEEAPAPGGAIYDLHVIENWNGESNRRPESLSEAVARLKAAGKSWRPLYRNLHLPLMTEVLPAMETTPLLHTGCRELLHGYYEIEGQANGRLRCAKRFGKPFLPHTIGPEDRQSLKPAGEDLAFVYTDVRHCEVTVLGWLSNDPELLRLVEEGIDLHKEIYRLVTGDECNTDAKRKMSKQLFLPVMYGMGTGSLAEMLGVSVPIAKELIDRIRRRFKVASDYMDARHDEAQERGVVEDHFGRSRRFAGEFYKARNFIVQSVAATACLDRLVGIHRALRSTPARLCYSVHDGYGIVAPRTGTREVARAAEEAIRQESPLMPGLRLLAESKAGDRLDALAVV